MLFTKLKHHHLAHVGKAASLMLGNRAQSLLDTRLDAKAQGFSFGLGIGALVTMSAELSENVMRF